MPITFLLTFGSAFDSIIFFSSLPRLGLGLWCFFGQINQTEIFSLLNFFFFFRNPLFSVLTQGEYHTLQEPWLEVVNPFILKNKERMIVFLDQLSNVTDPSMPAGVQMIDGMYHPNSATANQHTDTGKLLLFID